METGANPTAQKLLEAFVRLRRVHWRHSPTQGLTTSEIMVLFCIKRAATTCASALKVSEISSHLNVAPPTITQQIRSLETHGFVQRRMDKQDRRAVRITLTEKGEHIIKHASDHFLAAMIGLVENLGEEDSNKLAGLLTRVSAYFDETAERQPQTNLPTGDNR